MFMVETSLVEVERRIDDGEFRCMRDGTRLWRWGWSTRRKVRGVGWLRPRRLCCPVCGASHVLLPTSCLLRRADGVEVIGRGLELAARGAGHRKVAACLGCAASTVARWLRRARSNAAGVAVVVAGRVRLLDPLAPEPQVAANAIGAIVAFASALVAAFRVRFAMVQVAPWAPMSLVTAGMLLSPVLPGTMTNTT